VQCIGEREDEFLVVAVVLVENVVIEPARREHADESLLGTAGGRERRLEDIDLAADRIRGAALDRAGHDRFGRRRKPRFLAGDAEHGADAIHVGIEFWERVAFTGRFPAGSAFAGPQRARGDAFELPRVVLEIPAVPELAVADAAQSELHLLADHLGHLPGHGVSRADRRQPAGMGRSDRGVAALHVVFLGLPDPNAWLGTATEWPPFSSSA